MYEAAASCKDIVRTPVTNWGPRGTTLAGYCYAVGHGMKVQLVTPYRVSYLQRYGLTIRGNVTSVDPTLTRSNIAGWYSGSMEVLFSPKQEHCRTLFNFWWIFQSPKTISGIGNGGFLSGPLQLTISHPWKLYSLRYTWYSQNVTDTSTNHKSTACCVKLKEIFTY